MITTQLLGQLWQSNQQAVLGPIQKMTPDNYRNRLTPGTASAGFIALHTAEGMHGFAMMTFGRPMSIQPKQGRGVSDTGEPIDLEAVKQLTADSFAMVAEEIQKISHDEQWAEVVTSPMGQLTRMQMLAFLMHHNSYHAGQITQAIKKGKLHDND